MKVEGRVGDCTHPLTPHSSKSFNKDRNVKVLMENGGEGKTERRKEQRERVREIKEKEHSL